MYENNLSIAGVIALEKKRVYLIGKASYLSMKYTLKYWMSINLLLLLS
jgi:hypothetical protein